MDGALPELTTAAGWGFIICRVSRGVKWGHVSEAGQEGRGLRGSS